MARRLFGAEPLSEPVLGYYELVHYEQISVKSYPFFSFKKMRLQISSAKCRPFCPEEGEKRRICWHMFICMYLSISTPNKYVLLIAINCYIAPIFCGLKLKISSWHLGDMKLQSIYIEHDHGLQIYKSHYNEYCVFSFLSKTLPLLHQIYLWKHWNIFFYIYVFFSHLCCAGSRFFTILNLISFNGENCVVQQII